MRRLLAAVWILSALGILAALAGHYRAGLLLQLSALTALVVRTARDERPDRHDTDGPDPDRA